MAKRDWRKDLVIDLRSQCAPEKREFSRRMRRKPTPAEAILWQRVRRKALGVRTHRQAIIRGYIVDFYIPAWKIVIELDGSFHEGREEYDANRTKALNAIGLKVIRFPNSAVINDIASVLEEISTNEPRHISLSNKINVPNIARY